MEAIKTALAELVAAEARVHELVDPTIIDQRTRALAKANAAGILALADHLSTVTTASHVSSSHVVEPLLVSVTLGPINNMDDDRKPDILPDPKIAGEVPGAAGNSTEA